MKAEIITIGDEILNGQIVDTNSAWIALALAPLQIPIVQISSIADSEHAILKALAQAGERADLVIVTGGLGPTKDDITRETIAKYFDSPIVRDPAVLAHVEALFSRLGYAQMPVMNLRQADVLEKATVLFNDVGTAPGMWIEHEGVCYAFLPGVPFEMKYLIQERLLPLLREKSSDQFIYNRHLITIGLGESHLAERIADIEDALPSFVHLAYLPKLGLVRLRLTAVGDDRELLIAETDSAAAALAERLGAHVIAQEDLSFEEVIVQRFKERGVTLATAESCTGGNIAARITAIAGSSAMFNGGAVVYANAAKVDILAVPSAMLDAHGAVSEETVLAMAMGAKAKFKTDYAVATSGIAGPGGGTEEKPVGMICVAVVGQSGQAVRTFHFKNDRTINIERTVSAALKMLWEIFRDEE